MAIRDTPPDRLTAFECVSLQRLLKQERQGKPSKEAGKLEALAGRCRKLEGELAEAKGARKALAGKLATLNEQLEASQRLTSVAEARAAEAEAQLKGQKLSLQQVNPRSSPSSPSQINFSPILALGV